MALFTQQNRNLQIHTPLGPDKLLLSSMTGSEAMSRLFSFELALISEDPKILFKNIIGKNVSVSVELEPGNNRYFNGVISRFSQVSGQPGSTDETTRVSHYQATLVPKLWLLTRSAESKIFQNKSVPEIIEAVLTGNGITDFEMKQRGSYQSRDYCVQYRETHYNFIARLMEEEGLYYYFEHAGQSHHLVISDAPRANDKTPLQVSYQVEGRSPKDAVIYAIAWSQEIRPNKYALSDFNFETPNNSLKVDIPGKYHLAPNDLEVYDYPGDYATKAEGDKLVRVRIEEEEAQVTSISGSSNCIAFTAGHRFTLLNSYRSDLNNKEYILTSVTHTVSQAHETGAGADYTNSFTCIPADVPFRPPRHTPKPLVLGTQTAIVVGPSGEEIYTDPHGRVKVQFHWDREGKKNENSSCWIRVAQLWAGAGWGGMAIPRIGQEVVVEFLEGDPDRPIITGRVYHGTNKPPYGLPGEKTKSTIKSNSSLGGGGFNEFRFEDKKGSEEIFLHGQKDWTIAILNDKNQTVGHDETLAVTNNRTKTVGVNQSETVGVNKDIKVGANHSEVIGANMALKVGANKNEMVAINTAETIGLAKELTIGGLYQISVGGAMNETVALAKAEEIGAAKSVNVAANSSENVGNNKSVDAGSNISESAGKNFSIDAGKDISIRAGAKGVIEIADQLTIKCGSASITLKKNGDITIQGKNINHKGSGNIQMKANKILEN